MKEKLAVPFAHGFKASYFEQRADEAIAESPMPDVQKRGGLV